MATTTPDNLFSPNPSANYNLIADWATSMQSVQAALTKRGNLFTGTSAQRVAFTSATEGMHWQDTNGAKLEWRRSGVDWVPSGLAGSGTLSDRNSVTNAPEGFEWFDTSSKITYTWLNGAWVGGWVTPTFKNAFTGLNNFAYRYHRGTVVFRGSITRTSGGVGNTTAFTLPVGYRPSEDVQVYVVRRGDHSAATYYANITSSGDVSLTVASGGSGSSSANFGAVSFPL